VARVNCDRYKRCCE